MLRSYKEIDVLYRLSGEDVYNIAERYLLSDDNVKKATNMARKLQEKEDVAWAGTIINKCKRRR